MQNISAYNNRHIYIYLKSIYGLNTHNFVFICNYLSLNPKLKTSTLTKIGLTYIEYYIKQNYITKLNLKQTTKLGIKYLIIKSTI